MWRASLLVCVMLSSCSRHEDRPGAAQLTAAELPKVSSSFIESSPLLTHRVESSLASDPILGLVARNVEVTVTEGVATLRGSVADRGLRRDVAKAVADVPGIVRVKNEIDVSLTADPDLTASDEKIAFSLQRSLASLPSVAGDTDGVTIDVVSGRVTLRGWTTNVTTEEEVKRIARSTPGVLEVVDEIEVE